MTEWYELPEFTQEELLKHHTTEKRCSNCGELDWYPIVAGHNRTWTCVHCGKETIRVVG